MSIEDQFLDIEGDTSFVRKPTRLSSLPVFTRRKVLAMGETKAGKTYLGGTFPGMLTGKAAILEFDGSLNGLPRNVDKERLAVWQFLHEEINRKRLPLFSILYDLLVAFVPNPHKWETLMIDGLTTLSSLLLDEVMWDGSIGITEKKLVNSKNPANTKANFDEWAALYARLRGLFAVIDALPMNVYCTAMVKRDKNENTGAIVGMPACQGSFRQDAGRHFDAVILLTSKGGKHYAEPKGSSMYPGGIRGYKGPLNIEAPTYQRIFKEDYFA